MNSLKSAQAEKFSSVRFMASFVVSGVTRSQAVKLVPHWRFSAARVG